MPWTYAGSVETMEYKTLRYPGHAAIMSAIRDLGLLDWDPIEVDGVDIRPRDVFIARVERDLRRPDLEDLVALKVIAEGESQGRSGKVTFSLLDRYDTEHKISAMMRTTGYSLST